MTAIVDFGVVKAVIQDYKWSCSNKHLERLLNTQLDPDGPSGADPNPDGTAAQEAATLMGGKVISIEPVEYDENAVY